MSKYIAVDGCTVESNEISVSATINIIGSLSTVLFCDGEAAYAGTMTLSIVGATDGVFTQTAPTYAASIDPTAQKVKTNGNFVMRVDDEGDTVEIPGTDESGASGTISLTPVITDAGQSKVKAA